MSRHAAIIESEAAPGIPGQMIWISFMRQSDAVTTLPCQAAPRHGPGFPDDQQGSDPYECFFHGQKDQRKPHPREPRHKADEYGPLGQLVRHRIEHLSQIAHHMEAPGDIAVRQVRRPGHQQDSRRHQAVLSPAVCPDKDRYQEQPECRQQIE